MRLSTALGMARTELWPRREQGQDRHGCSKTTTSSLLFILHVHLLGVNITSLSPHYPKFILSLSLYLGFQLFICLY